MKNSKGIFGYLLDSRHRSRTISYAMVIAAYIILEVLLHSGSLSNLFQGLLVPATCYLVAAIGLNLNVGVSGELNLGQAGFMAVGAFSGVCVSGLLAGTLPAIPRLILAIIVGMLLTAGVGFLIGIPVLRLNGDYLAIVTLAFGEIIKNIMNVLYIGRDADGFHFINAGKMFTGRIPYSVACTPKGIIRLLDEYRVNLEGLNAVVIGRSNIVGKPVAQLLLQRNATVTMCHTKTKNIEFYTKNADLIVCATGKPEFLKGDMVKDGVIVIDVGISRKDGKLCGDVDFASVAPKASLITPVPGGVGPMTVAMLIQNTLDLTKRHIEDKQKKYITFL